LSSNYGIQVRRVETSDGRAARASVARAFTIDPIFGYFLPDRLRAHRVLPGLIAGSMNDLITAGCCWVADVDTQRSVGFAGWLPPEALPRYLRRNLTLAARSLGPALRVVHPIGGVRLLAEMERRHPHEPNWYLGLLAVDPDSQGRGVGSRLIRPGLDRADADGLPCYLETQKHENVSWYARFGVELEHTITIGSVPPIWCLWRPAR
jgi:GNAT superfamily N-acetyltransferase